MKRAARFLALTIALFVAGAAVAADPLPADPLPGIIEDVVAGATHENGGARWNSVVFSQLSDVCRLTGPDRKIELGKKAGRQPRANADDCVATSAWVQNTSQQPIYCRAVLKLNHADDSGRAKIMGQGLVMPGAMKSIATAYGEVAGAPSETVTEAS